LAQSGGLGTVCGEALSRRGGENDTSGVLKKNETGRLGEERVKAFMWARSEKNRKATGAASTQFIRR